MSVPLFAALTAPLTAFTAVMFAEVDGLPGWASTTVGVTTTIVVMGLWLTGKLRAEREVVKAEAETAAWKAAYEVQATRADAAEAAARHIMESGSVLTALVDALTVASSRGQTS